MQRDRNLSASWIALFLLVLVQTVAALGIYCLSVVAPFLEKDWNFTRTEIGALTSAIYLGSFVVSIPAGWLSDRFNVKKITIFSVFILCLTLVIFPFANNFLLAFLIMALSGLGYGILVPSGTRALTQWFPVHLRGRAFSIRQMGVTIGGSLSALLISFVVEKTGDWNLGYLIDSILLAIVGVLFFVFYYDAPKSTNKLATDKNKITFIQLLKNRNVMLVSLVSLFLGGAQFTFIAHVILYLTNDFAVPLTIAAILMFLAQIAGSAGKLGWGLLSDLFFNGRRKETFLIISVLSTIATASFGFIYEGISIFLLGLIIVLFGFTVLGFAGIYMTYIAESVDSSQVGTVSGFSMMFMYTGILIFPPIVGYIADINGSYQYVWVGISLFVFISTLLLALTSEKKSDFPITEEQSL